MSDEADYQPELREIAKSVIDDNLYMVLGTASEDGRPWVTPVYYSAAGYTDFYWVSRPEDDTFTEHRLAARSQRRHIQFEDTDRHRTGRLHVGFSRGGVRSRSRPRHRSLRSGIAVAGSGRVDAGEGAATCSISSLSRHSFGTIHSLPTELPRAMPHPWTDRRSSGRC